MLKMGICMKKPLINSRLTLTIAAANLSPSSHPSPLKLSEVYSLIKVLGKGKFGTVRKAVHKTHLDLYVAIKTISKNEKLFSTKALLQEIAILRGIDHPNIIKFYDLFEEPTVVHIVMEYCSGGELFDRIIEKGSLSEHEAARIMYKIVGAVNHLHLLGVCHRDLKPQNVLFENLAEDAEMKLIDFGLSSVTARSLKGAKDMHTFVGTPYYIAPEVLLGDYTVKCDVWSLGVIVYVMLTGNYPFDGESCQEIYRKVSTEWDHCRG
jgi:calcium-dependent protein kinase